MKRDETVYLNHIREACDRIAIYLEGLNAIKFKDNYADPKLFGRGFVRSR